MNKKERYFTIEKNGVISEFYTFQEAFNNIEKDIFIVDKFKKTYTPPGGYDWRISEFSFIDEKQNPYKLSVNFWVVKSIEIESKTSSGICFEIIFADPSHKIRHVKINSKQNKKYGDPNSNDIEIIQQTITKLIEYSKYKSWQEIDLLNDNEKLKEKIKSLEYEISKLKNSKA